MENSPGQRPRLSVSIVLHNTPLDQFCATLESLQRATRDAWAGPVVVAVVENAGPGDYREEVAALLARWPGGELFRVVHLPQPENLGFGAGHNSVLATLASEYHLVLNPDVELAPSALKHGLARLRKDRSIALLSPRVTSEDGGQEFLCKRYPSVLVLLLRGFAPSFMRRWFDERLADYEMQGACSGKSPGDVENASGCFMLVSTAALRAVGGFVPAYFLYFEDFDLSLRIREQGRLVFEPAMRIVHHGGHAARKGPRHIGHFAASGLRLFRQHGWRWI